MSLCVPARTGADPAPTPDPLEGRGVMDVRHTA
jgi:hypothetical protein